MQAPGGPQLGTMKALIKAIKGELPASRATERITTVCVIIAMVCFVALLIVLFRNPVEH